ncbi:rod shape-determining protein RodA [Magnetofaba australis]|uniref:Peptidoglycan glycosyltransferase MrdB n=1 Tax=Magnetofaba australis IT-1 TaxID=1434232 RepID=A0A1Y2K4Z7_9PROT|nr:rod shape-determining protein RodA [Magnetofaba australis]OSM02194.1 putative rod shape-determining protein RodA [Magnetofaba australis IT-1]
MSANSGKRSAPLTQAEPTSSLQERLYRFPWGLLITLLLIVAVGLLVLYSAVGGGESSQMLIKQGVRVAVAFVLMLLIAFSGEKFYRRHAYTLYLLVVVLLVVVFLSGVIGMGARRWLDLGVVRLQPSELMKVALVLALARYFHDRGAIKRFGWREIWPPLLMLALPMALILKQPDLGTALAVAAAGGVVIFVAGLPWRILIGGALAAAAAAPLLWQGLHDYQRRRVMTLFSPEEDPLGAGYHIIQSKIAVGSGGIVGKGFLAGSQNRLDFLPERHTDFIFSVLAEEWGFIGALGLLGLYGLIIARGLHIALNARNRFGMLAATGLTAMVGLQVVINIGMVIGLLPVVGIPLPLVSYGGSSMLTIMIAMGLLAHINIHAKPMSGGGV